MAATPEGGLFAGCWASAVATAFDRFADDRGRTAWALLGGLERACAELAEIGREPGEALAPLSRILVAAAEASFPPGLLPEQALPEHEARRGCRPAAQAVLSATPAMPEMLVPGVHAALLLLGCYSRRPPAASSPTPSVFPTTTQATLAEYICVDLAERLAECGAWLAPADVEALNWKTRRACGQRSSSNRGREHQQRQQQLLQQGQRWQSGQVWRTVLDAERRQVSQP